MDTTQTITDKPENIRVFEERIALLEGDADSLRSRVAGVRAELDQFNEMEQLREENDLLKQSILRYAIACGGVDLQIVLLRARGDSMATMENFQRATEEQTDASNALRALARQIQNIAE